MSINYNNIAILHIKGAGYCCIISRISKDEAINLMQDIDFTKNHKNNNNYYYIKKWVKGFQHLMILKLKKVKFYHHRISAFIDFRYQESISI